MNTTKQEQGNPVSDVPRNPPSVPLPPLSMVQSDDTDEHPDAIFLNAVAEIDTQPLPKRTLQLRWQDVLQTLFCVGLIVGSISGIIWQTLTYPNTLVILYTVEQPAHLTTLLAIPTHPLAPVTLTRSVTLSTTGHGYQDARAATGLVTLYNGNASAQTVASGTVLTGADGRQVATEQSVTIPAANPPTFGQATIPATTLQAGSASNLPSGDLNGTVSSSLFVKNLSAFTGGRDARTYRAVAQTDIATGTAQLSHTLLQALQTAFAVQPDEQAQPSHCQTTTTANQKPGDEASTVTLHRTETCTAIAYRKATFEQRTRQLFTTQTAPGKHYALVGSLSSTIISVTPLIVHLAGSWRYELSSDDKQTVAQAIQGKTPAQARSYLLHHGGIVQASVPATLPPAMYIQFLVLVAQDR